MKDKRSVFCIIGMAAGGLAILFGLIVMFKSIGRPYSEYMKFGADFYTEQYNATRNALLSINNQTEFLQLAIGAILITFGIADIAYFLIKAEEFKNSAKTVELLEKSIPTEVKEKAEINEALKF